MTSGLDDHAALEERQQRESFLDFLLGILDLDPLCRYYSCLTSSSELVYWQSRLGAQGKALHPVPDIVRLFLLAFSWKLGVPAFDCLSTAGNLLRQCAHRVYATLVVFHS